MSPSAEPERRSGAHRRHTGSRRSSRGEWGTSEGTGSRPENGEHRPDGRQESPVARRQRVRDEHDARHTAAPKGAQTDGSGRAGRAHARRARRILPGRRWPRRLLIITNVICLLLLALAGSAYGYVRWRLGQIKKEHVSGLTSVGAGSQSHKTPTTPAQPPMTVLITGSDTRAVGGGKFGSTSQVSGQRSDVIILARVVPATKQIALLSIPRDTLVNIPGIGHTRINAAFNGGPTLLIKTIKQDFGIQINHYIGVNFESFIQVADAIGGVEQYFPTPAKDIESGLNITHAGCVNLVGAQALAFVRSRNYQYYLNGQWNYQVYPESDLGRIQRQQAFIKAAVKKAKATGLTNPIRLDHIVAAVTKNLTIDNTFTTGQLINLAETFRHISSGTINNWTLPTTNSQAVPGALDTIPNLDQPMIQKFLTLGQTPKPAKPTRAHSSSSATTAHSPSPASSRAPTTTVLPGDAYYVNGQYVPPGRVSGQQVPTCGT